MAIVSVSLERSKGRPVLPLTEADEGREPPRSVLLRWFASNRIDM